MLKKKELCCSLYKPEYYLSKRLILKKIHRILEFKQSTKSKNLFKLLNNAVYGTTMENMRKRIKIRIIKKEKNLKEKDFIKYASRATYINPDIFLKRLVAIQEKKKIIDSE